ncbi:MAG TPA: hypothetical protein VFP14_01060 [Novosphingobium sp.]|nr:hypothetical protein [Novosphingobium sp.]
MPIIRTALLTLPIIVGAVMLGQAAPVAASIAVDATSASVQSPEAARTVRDDTNRSAQRNIQLLVIVAPKGATNLRSTPAGLLVLGVEARR